MDDLSQKLGSILNDPDSMNRIRQMAENILGEEQNNTPAAQNGISEMLGAEELGKVMSIISKLKSGANDPRSNLLSALKPHLSEPKRDKVDTAIKILKIIELLPLIKDTGLLNF